MRASISRDRQSWSAQADQEVHPASGVHGRGGADHALQIAPGTGQKHPGSGGPADRPRGAESRAATVAIRM